MVEIDRYHLSPTRLIPNSPHPLLHYKGLLAESERLPARIHDTLEGNGWQTQWIFRYGATQTAHYHSQVHECMAVLTGRATIRFGAADTSEDLEKSTHGGAFEDGGVELDAQAGDFFLIPAGVAHKTYNTSPAAAFSLLTPGEGRGIQAENQREALEKVELSGFTMMGAYPKDGGDWDFAVGVEDSGGDFERSWKVATPERDPMLGASVDGVCGQWKAVAP